MLYDIQGNPQQITNDKIRKKLYQDTINKLQLKRPILKYIDFKLEEYFNHYEMNGDFDKRVKVGYLFNSTWDNEIIHEIYEVLEITYKSQAYEKAKEVLGCLVREVMISDTEYEYLGEYIPEKGYNYKRSLI